MQKFQSNLLKQGQTVELLTGHFSEWIIAQKLGYFLGQKPSKVRVPVILCRENACQESVSLAGLQGYNSYISRQGPAEWCEG